MHEEAALVLARNLFSLPLIHLFAVVQTTMALVKAKAESGLWLEEVHTEILSGEHVLIRVPGCTKFQLRFVRDNFCLRLARFDLRAHLLDSRGLLFQLRCEDFHSFLLLSDH